jgi:hypothetical protein
VDDRVFREGMTELMGAYPREFALTPEAMAVWLKHLDALDGALFLAIVERWVERETRPPTIAAILGAARDLDPGESAEDAWLFVLDAVTHGSYRQRGFDPSAQIADAVRYCGGWRQIAMTNEDKLPFAKREFLAKYEVVRERSRVLTLIGSDTAERLRLHG